jgi:hypothetical protein
MEKLISTGALLAAWAVVGTTACVGWVVPHAANRMAAIIMTENRILFISSLLLVLSHTPQDRYAGKWVEKAVKRLILMAI